MSSASRKQNPYRIRVFYLISALIIHRLQQYLIKVNPLTNKSIS